MPHILKGQIRYCLLSDELRFHRFLLVGQNNDCNCILCHRVDAAVCSGDDAAAGAAATPPRGIFRQIGQVHWREVVHHRTGLLSAAGVPDNDLQLRLVWIRPKYAGGGVEALVGAAGSDFLAVGLRNELGLQIWAVGNAVAGDLGTRVGRETGIVSRCFLPGRGG